MKTAPNIRSYKDNITYYVGMIRSSLSEQLDYDIENATVLGNQMTEKSLFGDKIVNVTGQIGASCQIIMRACDNIERQVKIAEGKATQE